MFDIMKPSVFDDMFRMADAFMQYPFRERSLETNGLRGIIHRPHNIVNVKDGDGNLVAQRLEVVTTPFKKDEVKVAIKDDMLTVECGSENKEEQEGDDVVYKGISSQCYSFSIKLGANVDRAAIKAKNTDGVLTVTLPLKKVDEPKQITSIEVE